LTNSAFYRLQLSVSVSSITLHGENDSPSEKEAVLGFVILGTFDPLLVHLPPGV